MNSLQKDKSTREQFWLDDPANLFVNWRRFVPTNDMTVPEALNSVVRFTVYSSLLVALIVQKTQYLLLIPLVMLASILLVRLFPTTQVIQETFETMRRKVSKDANNAVATPTADNPFMNVLFTDFMDTSDTYGLMESSRNWVTQAATTIPNDLEGFQAFLNKDNVSRKGKSEEYVIAHGSTNNPIPVG